MCHPEEAWETPCPATTYSTLYPSQTLPFTVITLNTHRHSIPQKNHFHATNDFVDADASPVFRAASHPSEFVCEIAGEKWDSPWDIFQFRMRQPGTRNLPYLGSRSWNVATQETSEQISNQVHWVTYSQVEELTIAFAKGLIAMALVSTVEFPNEMYEPARRMAPLGIVSKNRPEWFVIEQATSATNCVLVPLYESLGDEALMHVLNQTQMGAMAVSKESGWAILQLLKRAETDERLLKYTSCLTTMILMDRVDGPFNELADSMNIRVVFWKDVVLEGRKRE